MKLFIIIIAVLLLSPVCLAKELYRAENKPVNEESIYSTLSGLEKQVYGRDYELENAQERVERLENSIYGKKSMGALTGRTERLKGSVFAAKSRKTNTKHQVFIEMLENRYFCETYPDEKIENRLTRLEQAIFGKPFVGDTEYRYKNLSQKVPLSMVGVSVSDSSGNKVSIKPEVRTKEQYSALSNLDYASSEGDYFNNINKNADNKVIRWKDFPVSVYLDKVPDNEKLKTAQKAIDLWGKYIQLSIVNNSRDADIIINWDDEGNNVVEPILYFDKKLTAKQVIIKAGYYKDPLTLDRFLIHELGHAVGIWGHSNNPKDIMYNFKELSMGMIYAGMSNNKSVPIKRAPVEPSTRDINTLIKIYNSPGQ